MKNVSFSVVIVLALACILSASAESGDALWGWNVSAGANFGFGLKPDLSVSPANAMRCMPQLTPSLGQTRQEAAASRNLRQGGPRVDYDKGNNYFVDPDSSWGEAPGHESETWNWRLPDSAVVGEGADRKFVLGGGEWGEVVSSSQTRQDVSSDDSSVTYGASVELSHGLFASEDAQWGIDIAFGLTWMKSLDCFKAGGVAVTRKAQVERGDTVTVIPGDFFAYPYASAEDDDTWGNGTRNGDNLDRAHYTLDLNDVTTYTRSLSSQGYSDSLYLDAHGDYEEWEISAILRPWYDVNDWLCVHGTLGIGVTRSSFEYQMEAACGSSMIYQSSQEFDEWRCYGIAGAGVLFRIWDFDLSCDGLFRWCQQDMEINSPDVNGTIQKPWGVLRLGLSYAF